MSILSKIKNTDWSYSPYEGQDDKTARALAKAINSVPDMLSIIERLAKRTEIDPVIDIKAEAQHLLNQLNKEL